MNFKRVTEGLKYHVVDSVALLTAGNPMFTIIEKALGMTNEVSLNTRYSITALTFLGFGYALGKLRDYSKDKLGIDNKYTGLYDSVFMGTTNLPLSLGLYLFAGEKDISNIVGGVSFSMAVGFAMGWYFLGSIDVFRDLSGFKECNRRFYPKYVRNLASKTKKAVALGLAGLSIAAMAGIYSLDPHTTEKIDSNKHCKLEELVQ